MPKIDQVFAFIAEESPVDEGVAAFLNPETGMWLPMVAADESRVDSLRAVAQQTANLSGMRIRLVRFKVREELEIIDPAPKHQPS